MNARTRAGAIAIALALVSVGGASAPGGQRTDLDLSAEGGTAPFLSRFDRSLLLPAAAPDQIPSIDRPVFDTPAQADALLAPADLVLGLERGGEAHAYPLNLLSLHEVVNDVVGGEPLAVTWCPLCQTALAYERRVADRVLTFGVSGHLYQANLLLFDRETRSLWSQLLGGAVTGSYRGTRLLSVPLAHTTWADWRSAHPATRVLSIARDEFASRFTAPDVELTSRGEELSNVPYAAYATKTAVYFPRVVRGVQEGERVLGVVANGHAQAYTLDVLRAGRALNLQLGGLPLLVTFDPDTYSASVFSRRVDGRVLTFALAGADAVRDRETGTRWALRDGTARSGPLARTRLARVPSTFSYWFAWRRFHPATAVARRPP